MGTTAKKVLGYGGLAAGTYFTGGALLGAKVLWEQVLLLVEHLQIKDLIF